MNSPAYDIEKIDRVRGKVSDPDQDEHPLEAFNRMHAVAMLEGRAVILYREKIEGTERFTTRYSTPGDMALRYKPTKIEIKKEKGGTEEVELFRAWLGWEKRRTYSQVHFTPIAELVAGTLTLPDTASLNLYQGLSIAPARGCCERIKQHIQAVWCAGSVTAYEYVMDWLARMFQRPGERGHTVIILRSGEGSGKNIIVDMLVEAFGQHAMVAVKPDDLTGRFNDDLATSVLVFANESIWGGDKSREGALKALITDPELPIERKYIPRFRVRNCCHLIMASNNEWVAPIGIDDRRFFVLDVSEHRVGDREYFRALMDEIEHGGKAAFIHELLNRDISKFEPRDLPDTKSHHATKFAAKLKGADTVTQWWADCLVRGEIFATVERELDHGMTLRMVRVRENLAEGWEAGPIVIDRDALYGAYLEWTHDTRKPHVESFAIFARKLRSLSKVRDTRKGPKNGDRIRMYSLDTLDTARATLDTIMKSPGPWAVEEVSE